MSINIREKVIMTILNHLPSAGGDNLGGSESDLGFFLSPEVFPCGDDLGQDREAWHFGFSWLDGLGSLSLIHI